MLAVEEPSARSGCRGFRPRHQWLGVICAEAQGQPPCDQGMRVVKPRALRSDSMVELVELELTFHVKHTRKRREHTSSARTAASSIALLSAGVAATAVVRKVIVAGPGCVRGRAHLRYEIAHPLPCARHLRSFVPYGALPPRGMGVRSHGRFRLVVRLLGCAGSMMSAVLAGEGRLVSTLAGVVTFPSMVSRLNPCPLPSRRRHSRSPPQSRPRRTKDPGRGPLIQRWSAPNTPVWRLRESCDRAEVQDSEHSRAVRRRSAALKALACAMGAASRGRLTDPRHLKNVEAPSPGTSRYP